MGLTSPTPEQLLTESCIFWSIGAVLFIGRLISRSLRSKPKKSLDRWSLKSSLQADDYVMMATFCFYTVLMILIQLSARYATNLMDPKDYDEVLHDPKQVSDRIYGSKLVVGLEQCMLVCTWGVKACLLIIYYKVTHGLSRIYYHIVTGYVVFGFLFIEVTYFAVYCRPFPQYWAMPVRDLQCSTYQHYSITQAVFNISSDVLLLATTIPLIWRIQIPWRRKIPLLGVFSLGIFVIIAAILNKYFNFASPLTTTYMIWYIRESSTAVYVANLMCLWPLLRKIFPLKAFTSSRSGSKHTAIGTSIGFSNLESSTSQDRRMKMATESKAAINIETAINIESSALSPAEQLDTKSPGNDNMLYNGHHRVPDYYRGV